MNHNFYFSERREFVCFFWPKRAPQQKPDSPGVTRYTSTIVHESIIILLLQFLMCLHDAFSDKFSIIRNFPNSQTQHILSSAVLYSFSPSSQLLHISSLFSVRFILFLRRRARVRCLPFFSPPSSSLSSPKASTHSSAQHQSEGMEKKKRRKKLFAKVSLSQWIAVELYGSVFWGAESSSASYGARLLSWRGAERKIKCCR